MVLRACVVPHNPKALQKRIGRFLFHWLLLWFDSVAEVGVAARASFESSGIRADKMVALLQHSKAGLVAEVRGQVVLCGAESHCHLFTIAGMCVASSALDLREVWDVAAHQTSTDVIGASMAFVGAARKVALLTAVGREPTYLTF